MVLTRFSQREEVPLSERRYLGPGSLSGRATTPLPKLVTVSVMTRTSERQSLEAKMKVKHSTKPKTKHVCALGAVLLTKINDQTKSNQNNLIQDKTEFHHDRRKKFSR